MPLVIEYQDEEFFSFYDSRPLPCGKKNATDI